jgi:hypothetical protein
MLRALEFSELEEDPMRSLTITAAISASVVASQAMADPSNWVPGPIWGVKDAIVGGQSSAPSDPRFICRAVVNKAAGDKYPGGMQSNSNGCEINYGGTFYLGYSYELLTPAWRSSTTITENNGVPVSATYLGGHGIGRAGMPAVPLYFCRADFRGGKHLGKVFPGSNGCAIPWGGSEHRFVTPYEVLV